MSSKTEERLNTSPYSKGTNLSYRTSYERVNLAPAELSLEKIHWGTVMTGLQ